MTYLRPILAALALSLAAIAPASAQDIQRGFDAFNRGDYAEAHFQFRLLAEQGDARAQYTLGTMYYRGVLAPQDFDYRMTGCK